MSFKEIRPEELQGNCFERIGKQWMLITAQTDGKANTMTASWGGLGVLWMKDVVFAFIRPQRYTKQFVDGSDRFSLTFLDESYRKTLGYLGTASGRDEDKIGKSGLHLIQEDGVPCFEEAEVTIIARKIYAQDIDPDCFLDKGLIEENYEGDYHTVYVGQIEKVLVRE